MKFFIVDGNSFLYRAYYAIRLLSTSKGEPTNAIYGFITMMNKLIQEGAPEYLAICFDRREPTFRHEKFKDYKAQRKPMPDDLAEQIEPIKNFCHAYRYAIFEKAGFEADDIIGTLARMAEEKGFEVYIVTGDKDAMQLVNGNVKILNPHKEGVVLGVEDVRKRLDGIGPERVVDLMALMGDSSDNIPGVSGIGEKTAIKLIQKFNTVENLLKQIDKVSSKSQQNLLRKHEKEALLSKELAQIDVHVPLEVRWDDLKLSEPDGEALISLFKRYEFRALLKNVKAEESKEDKDRNYKGIVSEKDFKLFLAQIGKVKVFSFDTETTGEDPMRAELVGMSFSWEARQAFYIPVRTSTHGGPGLPKETVLKALQPILENEKQGKCGQNIKYDWIVMKRMGIELKGIVFDTMIASYLINPIKLNHNLDDIAMEYLGIRKISIESLIGSKKEQISMADVPLEKVTEYAGEDADCVFRLKSILEEKLDELELKELFLDVEIPLSQVLAKMEMNGVYLDLGYLQELSERAGDDLKKLTAAIYHAAGEEFNINSTKQLADILFTKMKLPVIKRTKTGYSTDVSVLEKLSLSYELPRMILEYREKAKLKSTYLDALPEMIHPETRAVHTSYHQTTTATGRLSSSDPNLQNIPIRTEGGRLIRKAFVPRPEKGKKRRILSADYSQIELRILAHLSGDESLTEAFRRDRDIHKVTATRLYDVSENEVTRQMRDVAKTINFSVIYGKTAYGLSQDLGISVSEADSFISNYFERYAKVKAYLESQKDKAREQGYLITLLGRRSYFPDIHSKNVQVRQFAERAAINAPIQGSAADLIKLAMIRIERRLEAEKCQSLMIMQVHDELVFDVAAGEQDQIEEMVREEMEGAYSLKVPLKVDIFVGDSWYKN
ncbi:MAG: DNA polymerase I [Candidatus Omnitrophica bacterium]|nr:DNA polymerase I [Candidatus Omnitrophota bacterium]